MRKANFDIDVLRSFATGVELRSFAKAAAKLNKSTSAVSAQMKKLEDQAGACLLRRSGRNLILTESGETILAYARRLIELNDEAAEAVRESASGESWVRLGLQDDFVDMLPGVLARFAASNPNVRIEARLGRNSDLLGKISTGQLDIAFAWDDGTDVPFSERIADIAMRWIAPADEGRRNALMGKPIPLVAFEAPCVLRSLASEVLDREGLPWRVSFTSPTLGGLWAAVAAGLGLTVRTEIGMPADVRALSEQDGFLPRLPRLGLTVYRSEGVASPSITHLETLFKVGSRALVSQVSAL